MKKSFGMKVVSLAVVSALLVTMAPGPVSNTTVSAASAAKITYTKPPVSPTFAQLPKTSNIQAAHGLPIVPAGKSVTLKLFAPLATRNDNFVDNEFTKLIQKDTGLKLEFVTAPASDAQSKRNLLLASNDYPDIIVARGMKPAEVNMYAEQGIFIPLDDLIKDYAPNTQKAWKEYPNAKLITTMYDGKVYSLPDINDCYHCRRGEGRLWFYRPWMDKLNSNKLPETTAELKDYLLKIKNNDPNGNGKKDEVPLAFNKSEMLRGLNYFANAFQVYPNGGYRLDNDKIVAAFTTDQFKDTLVYMNDLYKNGLILADAFSIENKDLVTIGETPEGPVIGSLIGWGPEAGTAKAGDTLRWFDFFVMPTIKGPTGQRNAIQTGQWNAVQNVYFVTDKCKEPIAAVRLGDLLLSDYYGYSAYIGPEGTGWTYSTDGTKGIGGGTATYKELVTYGAQKMNTSWDQVVQSFRSEQVRLDLAAENADMIYKFLDGDYSLRGEIGKLKENSGAYNEIMKYYGSKKQLEPYVFDEKYIVPPLIYESKSGADAEASDITTVIDNYFKQKVAEFVTGADNINTNFPAFVSELNKMGLQKLLGHMQKAYETKYKKK